MLTRRRFGQLSGLSAGWAAVGGAGWAKEVAAPATAENVRLEIAPYTLEVSAKRSIKTMAYNGQVPGALVRMRALPWRPSAPRRRCASSQPSPRVASES